MLDWAQSVGLENSVNNLTGKSTTYWFPTANALVFNKIREELGLDQCKVALVGAAPISKACSDYFLSFNIPVLNAYGMTECAAPASMNRFNKMSIDSAGSAVTGTELVIKGSNGDILPAGAKGEICFRGRHKFMGYYKNEKATRETIDSDGFIHSGDEGILDENGFLFITGRFKELIITSGGENIPPVLIENAVKERCKIISNVLLVGDGKKYLSMLITFKLIPNIDGSFSNQLIPEVIQFIKGLGINATTIEDLIKSPEIYKYIDEIILNVNKEATSRAQEIKRYRFLTTDFSIAGGELTPTMKTKRNVIVNKYISIIDDIYNHPKL